MAQWLYRGLYSSITSEIPLIYVPILDPDYRYRPLKTINPVGKGQKHVPSLSVCLYCLSACDLACLLGFRACHRNSTTGCPKKVPDPTACWDGHYGLSVTFQSWWGFHN